MKDRLNIGSFSLFQEERIISVCQQNRFFCTCNCPTWFSVGILGTAVGLVMSRATAMTVKGAAFQQRVRDDKRLPEWETIVRFIVSAIIIVGIAILVSFWDFLDHFCRTQEGKTQKSLRKLSSTTINF